MAKPNYSFEKRQRELAKKKKKEEKRLRKAGLGEEPAPGDQPSAAGEASDTNTPDKPTDDATPAV